MTKEAKYSCDKKGWEKNVATTWEQFCRDALECANDHYDPEQKNNCDDQDMMLRLLFQRIRRLEVAHGKSLALSGK